MLKLGKASLSARSSTSVIPMLEHFARGRIEGPVASLATAMFTFDDIGFIAGYFNEAVVEAKIVSDTVLPALSIIAVVREPLHYESVYSGQGESLLR